MSKAEIWVVIETNKDREIADVSKEILSEGKRIAGDLESSLCGIFLGRESRTIDCDEMATAAQYGAAKIYSLCHPLLENYSTEVYCQALLQLMENYGPPRIMLIGSTPDGLDWGPRLAVRVAMPILNDCTMLKVKRGALEITKPLYQDKIYATIHFDVEQGPAIIGLQPGAAPAEEVKIRNAHELISFQPEIDETRLSTRALGYRQKQPQELELGEVDVIVSGGRGIGSKANWQMLESLAPLLRAGVGGSRMALDSGWIQRERLVGQTGSTVKPCLYLAAGISGQREHMNGLQEAERILCINKDRTAPIFKYADKGIVGDLVEILPVLIEELKKRMAREKS